MSNEFKLLSVEPTQEMLDAITTERKKGNGALQCWYAAFGAAPQPPALGGEPEVFAWAWSEVFVGGNFDGEEAHDGISFGAEKPNIRPSISGTVVKYLPLVSRAHLALLQAEIERLTKYAEAEAKGGDSAVEDALFIARKNRELRARNVHLEGLLQDSLPALDLAASAFKRCKPIRDRARAALPKPAGSEQI